MSWLEDEMTSACNERDPLGEPAAPGNRDLIMAGYGDTGPADSPSAVPAPSIVLAPQAGHAEGSRRRWAVLAVVSAAQFLIVLDTWVVNIALPVLRRDFAPATLADVSWILDVYAIVLAALLLPAGRIADRIGRRRFFLAGLVVFGVASVGCAVAPDLPALIAARVLQAVGAAVLMPTSLGLALSAFPARQRGTAVGIWAAIGTVAAGSGPVLGGFLVLFSWRWIFLINLPIVLAALVAGAAILPRAGEPQPGRRAGQGRGLHIDGAGAVLVLGAVGLVCTALTEAQGWPPARTWLVLAAGLILGAAFVVHIRRHRDPLVAPRLFAHRPFSAGAGGLVAYYTGFAAMLLGTTLLLTVQWQFSVLQAAIAIAPAPVMAGIVSPFSGKVSARFGTRRTVIAGAVAFAGAGAWPLAIAGSRPAYAVVVLPSLLAWGLANALIQPPLFAAAGTVPQAELASGSAVLATARQLGSALGVAIFVAVLGSNPAGRLAGFDRAWVVVVITAAITALAGLAACGRPVRQARGTTVRLREGSAVLIRQVNSADAPLVADGFARLSPQSRQMRFLAPKKVLLPAELRRLTAMDHHDHEALGALDQADGRGVGIARYVRDAGDPQAAEVAVTVVDEWQGRGVATELLTRLSDRARQEGIHRFTALVAEDNKAVAGLLQNMHAEPLGRGPGTVQYQIALEPAKRSGQRGGKP